MRARAGVGRLLTSRLAMAVYGVLALLVIVEATRTYQSVRDLQRGRTRLETGQQVLEEGRLDTTSAQGAEAGMAFLSAQRAFGSAQARFRYDPIFVTAEQLPWLGSQLRAVETLSEVGDQAAAIGLDAVAGSNAVNDLRARNTSLPEQTMDLIAALDPRITDIETRARTIDAESSTLSGEPLVPKLRGVLEDLRTRKSRLDELLTTYARARELAPSFLGFAGTRHYLVVAQNNAELMPTGGIVTAMERCS